MTFIPTFRKSRRAQSTEDYETWVPDDVTNTLNIFDNTGDVRATQAIAFALRGREDGANAETSGELASALRTPGGGSSHNYLATGPQYGVRRLTPLECERLQGFPDHWGAGQSDSQRYRQMGNAVNVAVTDWLGGRIVEALAD